MQQAAVAAAVEVVDEFVHLVDRLVVVDQLQLGVEFDRGVHDPVDLLLFQAPLGVHPRRVPVNGEHPQQVVSALQAPGQLRAVGQDLHDVAVVSGASLQVVEDFGVEGDLPVAFDPE